MNEPRLVCNRIQTPDGTILTSYHRHDYVTHLDKNGLEYMVDGGLDYLRRTIHESAPYKELSVYSDAPFEVIRTVVSRGGRGKDGTEELKWVPLCEMSDNWLEACIVYNLEKGFGESFSSMLYVAEQDFRTKNGIVIAE